MSRARTAWAFARVDDDHALLPEEERALSPAASEKRRREHAAGRAAARRALRRLVGRELPVLRRSDGAHLGAPFVALDGVYVSISHHDGLAVAAASTAPVGVDLARVEDLGAAFCDTAFVDGELDAWRTYGDAAEAVAFAAKEACAKLLGVGFALPLLGFRASPLGVDVSADVAGCPRGFVPARVRVRLFAGGARVLVAARLA